MHLFFGSNYCFAQNEATEPESELSSLTTLPDSENIHSVDEVVSQASEDEGGPSLTNDIEHGATPINNDDDGAAEAANDTGREATPIIDKEATEVANNGAMPVGDVHEDTRATEVAGAIGNALDAGNVRRVSFIV